MNWINSLLDEIRNINSSKPELKKFGFSVGGVLVLISLIFYFLGSTSYFYILSPGLLLIVFGLVIPELLLPLQKIWMAIAVILGFFMTRIILSLLFYLIISPIGLIAKLFGKDFLDRKINNNDKSYWNYRTKKDYEKVDSERQF